MCLEENKGLLPCSLVNDNPRSAFTRRQSDAEKSATDFRPGPDTCAEYVVWPVLVANYAMRSKYWKLAWT